MLLSAAAAAVDASDGVRMRGDRNIMEYHILWALLLLRDVIVKPPAPQHMHCRPNRYRRHVLKSEDVQLAAATD
jgi:hypothetical protein